VIPKSAIERIGMYLGKDPAYDTIEGLEADLRAFSPFGELTPENWRHLAINSAKQDEQGKWHFRYDPGIAKNFHAVPPMDVDLRAYWRAVPGPVLVIRGESSDLLLPATLDEMCTRPRTEKHVVPRTGHSPMLMDDAQAGVIRRFLLG
jgi:pimeloyl-ACP methyl ester carboxylesterase